MKKMLSVYIICLALFHCYEIDAMQVGLIRNMSLIIANTNSTIINGTCQECLCLMASDAQFSSFNCHTNNQTCQMHSKTNRSQSFNAIFSSSTHFYFFSLPLSPLNSTPLQNSTNSSVSYLWSFDSNYSEQTSTWTFLPVNQPTFSSSVTITGRGSSVFFNATRFQNLYIPNSFVNLANSSWTFEVWIYPITLFNQSDHSIISQCQSDSAYLCLHLAIRDQSPYFGFFSDDCQSNQRLSLLRWSHLAFVFNCSTKTQLIYVNGAMHNSCFVNQCYQGESGNFTIGTALSTNAYAMNYSQRHFHGYIDELRYFDRAKTSQEILDDATLTAYMSFNDSSFEDHASLRIPTTAVGSINSTTGRIGQALRINDLSHSYLRLNGLVLLGIQNQSFSMSLWIQPNLQRSATIIHVSSQSNGLGWCLDFLSVLANGQLMASFWSGVRRYMVSPSVPLNQWTHVTMTYSSLAGLRMYINGTSTNVSVSFGYQASEVPNYIFLGSAYLGTNYCGTSSSSPGQYSGLLDEFRLYSRELTADECFRLANP